MCSDDALVVIPTPLLWNAVCDPVVAEIVEGLVWRQAELQAPRDLLDFAFTRAELEDGIAVFLEHLAAPLAILVGPTNAPLAPVPDRFAHTVSSQDGANARFLGPANHLRAVAGNAGMLAVHRELLPAHDWWPSTLPRRSPCPGGPTLATVHPSGLAPLWPQKRKTPVWQMSQTGVFTMVAGPGFEPGTFGL
jgi:hypothetical protein